MSLLPSPTASRMPAFSASPASSQATAQRPSGSRVRLAGAGDRRTASGKVSVIGATADAGRMAGGGAAGMHQAAATSAPAKTAGASQRGKVGRSGIAGGGWARKRPHGAAFLGKHQGRLANDLVQLALGVALGHLVEANRLDLAGLTGGTEGFKAGQADLFGGFTGRLQVV